MRAGSPALCFGTVMHHRIGPPGHRFTNRVNQVWVDPDDLDALADRHPLWSTTGRRPIELRRSDYFDGSGEPIGPPLRRLAASVLGREPTGTIRMLTQPRTWGWLFNPITIYLLWDAEAEAAPVAAVLEVTNTPWKERHRYPLALTRTTPWGPSAEEGQPHSGPVTVGAGFDKALHVSPFLDQHYRYRLGITEHGPGTNPGRDPGSRLTVTIDLFDERIQRADDDGEPVLTTRLSLDRRAPDRTTMTEALFRNPFPTHKVSLGIHRQALALWRKGVPFVAHPRRRKGSSRRSGPSISSTPSSSHGATR